MKVTRLVIITGLSGSGKSLAANCFEDMGFYCVDNLPIRLIPVFMDLIWRTPGDIRQVALVIDVREGAFLKDFPEILDQLRREELDLSVLFFEATNEALLRRFSETRRPHPLAGAAPIEEGIRKEREILRPIRDRADKIIESSSFNVHELRAYLFDNFSEQSRTGSLFISVVSFGYKYGVPPESDMMFDIRFLPNPHFVEGLRPKTGLDPEVASYIEAIEDYQQYYQMVFSLMLFLVPRFIKEGKTYLTISIGCTGGRHRSVSMAQKMGEELARQGYRVKTTHRDLWKT
ncbi:MAG TPA: RNase adapter RapZ [Candidatus Polarisedimenticolia bacterium]|nr:RNase adapter RapZ [Candidatus Polarisedimenticolia bacterium]